MRRLRQNADCNIDDRTEDQAVRERKQATTPFREDFMKI
jgi:hypothetical protein